MRISRQVVVVFGFVWLALVSWGGSPAWAKKKKKKRGETIHIVQDFEAEDLSAFVRPSKMTGERYALSEKGAGHAYRCSVAGGDRVSWLTLRAPHADVTPFRLLRFRIRGEGTVDHPCHVRILNNADSLGLQGEIDGLTDEWQTVDLMLPEMIVEKGFDPTKVVLLEFLWFEPPSFSFEVDDIEFVEVKKAGGWKYSDEEMVVHIFGEKRRKKVKHLETKHFDIYTDSAAARKKFPKALEATYTFVRDALGVSDFKTRLPVYIFQSPQLYFEFCVRFVGWTLQGARNSAGHGSGRYFAVYYQAPKSDVVTHELTHSIFHRTVGGWGGSWFQEGVAVYIENLALEQSAAAEFAPILRGGRHTPLREFITIDRLIDAHNLRGGSSEASNRYLQAGALFEFLMRSRVLAPKVDEAVPDEESKTVLPKEIFELAKARGEGDELAAEVEKILGMSIEDLEKAWIKWGSHPPKSD